MGAKKEEHKLIIHKLNLINMENNKRSEVVVVAHVGLVMTTTIDRLHQQFKEQGIEDGVIIVIDDIRNKVRRLEPRPIRPQIELAIIEKATDLRPINSWQQRDKGRGKRKYYHK